MNEHRYVTDAEAKIWEESYESLVGRDSGGRWRVMRLLADRAVAMEMIKEAADIAEMVEADYEEAYDFRVKARALIAAVKGEE
ncbi:MAG: hypothetical protein J3T61_00545 [Candidatus Brocadiales bacterium]|nr:hypothetical protein [Candidatus Bathyanammoxibius sp.]